MEFRCRTVMSIIIILLVLSIFISPTVGWVEMEKCVNLSFTPKSKAVYEESYMEIFECPQQMRALQHGGEGGEDTKGLLLLDVTPLSFGIETVGGVMTKMIPRNSVFPVKNSQVFSTYQDQQTSVTIKVYEGERSMTKDCHELGSFDLSGIPPAPRGVPQIEVIFELDEDAILHVTAQDKAANKSKSITITSDKNSRLSHEEIYRMIREAEEREKVDSQNKLETYVYNMKSTINDKLAEKIDSDDKKKIENTLKETMEWLSMEWLDDNQSAEKEDYDWKMKELEDVCNPIIRQAYEKSGASSANSGDDDDHGRTQKFLEGVQEVG